MSDQTEQEAIEQQKDAHLVAQALADSGRASGGYAFNRYAGRHGALVAHHARLKEVAAETARQLSEAQLEIEGLKEKLVASHQLPPGGGLWPNETRALEAACEPAPTVNVANPGTETAP